MSRDLFGFCFALLVFHEGAVSWKTNVAKTATIIGLVSILSGAPVVLMPEGKNSCLYIYIYVYI
jgi:hypothetical protein